MRKVTKILTYMLIMLVSAAIALLIQDVYASVFHLKSLSPFSIYPAYLTRISGVNQEGDNTYKTNNNDPQMTFAFPAQEMNTVLIRFSGTLNQDVLVAVYYATEEQGFAQERCASDMTNAKQRDIHIELPKGAYDKLRLDIGTQEGIVYTVNDVLVGQTTQTFPWTVFICVFAITALSLWHCTEKLESIIQKPGGALTSVLLDGLLIATIILQIGTMPVNKYLLILLAIVIVFFEAEFILMKRPKESEL